MSYWGVEPSSALARARRIRDLLVPRRSKIWFDPGSSGIGVGVLRPESEVVCLRNGLVDRSEAETTARGLIEAGELVQAGFAAFEIDEPAVNRIRWLRGLTDFARDLAPSSPGISGAAELLRAVELLSAEGLGDGLFRDESRELVDLIRNEIPPFGYGTNSGRRAVYDSGQIVLSVADLSMRVLNSMAWRSYSPIGTFDRDTGWGILSTALDPDQPSARRKEWLRRLFPVTSGFWE